jgi:hypothetical protein
MTGGEIIYHPASRNAAAWQRFISKVREISDSFNDTTSFIRLPKLL